MKIFCLILFFCSSLQAITINPGNLRGDVTSVGTLTTIASTLTGPYAITNTLTRGNTYYKVKAFVATGTITSTTLATFSNQTGLSFTPPTTANYRVSCQATYATNVGGALQNAIGAVRATTGSPTYLAYGDAFFITISTNSYIPAFAYVDVTLTGGVAYVFQVQGMIDAGTLNMDNTHTANGTWITAFQIN